jgi:hypothetical protein
LIITTTKNQKKIRDIAFQEPNTKMQLSVCALVAAAQLATAHFGIEYPEWRADTLMVEDGPYSQYDYPCELKPSKMTFLSLFVVRAFH